MRTTLTLDDDVAAALEHIQKTNNLSLKVAVNKALRAGLKELASTERKGEPFQMKSFDVGRCLIGNLDNIGEVLAIAEGEDYK